VNRKKPVIIFLLIFCVTAAHAAEKPHAYDARGKRDPFVPLVGALSKGRAEVLEDVMSIEELELQGIAGDSLGRMVAILNGEMVREGETIGRVTVKRVLGNTVKLTIDGNEHTLNVYDGRGQ